MSEEEKKAIKNMKLFATDHQNMAVVTAKDMNIVLNLVKKLQKKIGILHQLYDDACICLTKTVSKGRISEQIGILKAELQILEGKNNFTIKGDEISATGIDGLNDIVQYTVIQKEIGILQNLLEE